MMKNKLIVLLVLSIVSLVTKIETIVLLVLETVSKNQNVVVQMVSGIINPLHNVQNVQLSVPLVFLTHNV